MTNLSHLTVIELEALEAALLSSGARPHDRVDLDALAAEVQKLPRRRVRALAAQVTGGGWPFAEPTSDLETRIGMRAYELFFKNLASTPDEARRMAREELEVVVPLRRRSAEHEQDDT